MHPLIYNFAYHLGSTTLADGDYELISDQVVEVAEDPENAVENLTEAPNQSVTPQVYGSQTWCIACRMYSCVLFKDKILGCFL
jgi:hypothetical protein